MKFIVASTMFILLFTGCSGSFEKLVVPSVKSYVVSNGLNDYMTAACIDIWEKQECPEDTLGLNFGVPYTQGLVTARVCIGFTPLDSNISDGRVCFLKDFIEKYE